MRSGLRPCDRGRQGLPLFPEQPGEDGLLDAAPRRLRIQPQAAEGIVEGGGIPSRERPVETLPQQRLPGQQVVQAPAQAGEGDDAYAVHRLLPGAAIRAVLRCNFAKILSIPPSRHNRAMRLPAARSYALTTPPGWWRQRGRPKVEGKTPGCGGRCRIACARLALLVSLIGGLAGCAAGGGAENDPFEPVNRAVFGFNRVVDGLVLEPAAELYGLVAPRPVKTAVRNLLDNLTAPVVFANDLLQGERERAGTALGRFMVNSTLGLFGLYDMAAEFGLRAHSEDFGQTLAVWGAGEGPYLVLPLLGPSNPRDLAGRIVDGFLLDPLTYLAPASARAARSATEAVVVRYELDPVLDDLERNSLDFYAAVRASYRQRRASEIRNGAPPPLDPSLYQEFPDDPFADPEAE